MPPNIYGGTLKYNISTFGSLASLECIIPFSLKGSKIYSCNATGVWLGSGECGKILSILHFKCTVVMLKLMNMK